MKILRDFLNSTTFLNENCDSYINFILIGIIITILFGLVLFLIISFIIRIPFMLPKIIIDFLYQKYRKYFLLDNLLIEGCVCFKEIKRKDINEDCNSWEIKLPDLLNDYKSIFVLGAFKTGKSWFINELTSMPLSISHPSKNTLGELLYLCNFDNFPLLVSDCEGLFQYTNKARDTQVYRYAITRISGGCDIIIYVLERTFTHDIETILKLNQIYQSCNCTLLLIIHNYHKANNVEELKQIIDSSDGLLEDSALINGFSRTLSHTDRKNVMHYVLGNKNTMVEHNSKIITQIKQFLIYSQNAVKENLKRNIELSIKAVFESYYELGDDSYFEIDSYLQFFGKSNPRNIIEQNKFDLYRVDVEQFLTGTHLFLIVSVVGLIDVKLDIITHSMGRLNIDRIPPNQYTTLNQNHHKLTEDIYFKAPVITFDDYNELSYQQMNNGVVIIQIRHV